MPLYEWLADNLGWLPFFAGPGVGQRPDDVHRRPRAGRDDPADHLGDLPRGFIQTPALHEEAALALGATRWEMIRMAVLPYGRPGVIGAVMLGLGRALGETMAVATRAVPAGASRVNLISLQPHHDRRRTSR